MKIIASRLARIAVGTFMPSFLFSILIYVSYTNFAGDDKITSLFVAFIPYLTMAFVIGTIPCLIGSLLVEFTLNPKIKGKTSFIICNTPLGIGGAVIFLSDPLNIFEPDFTAEMSLRGLEVLGYGVAVSTIVAIVLRFLYSKDGAITRARNAQ